MNKVDTIVMFFSKLCEKVLLYLRDKCVSVFVPCFLEIFTIPPAGFLFQFGNKFSEFL